MDPRPAPRPLAFLDIPADLLLHVWEYTPVLGRLALRATSNAAKATFPEVTPEEMRVARFYKAVRALEALPEEDQEPRFFKTVQALETLPPDKLLDGGRTISREGLPFDGNVIPRLLGRLYLDGRLCSVLRPRISGTTLPLFVRMSMHVPLAGPRVRKGHTKPRESSESLLSIQLLFEPPERFLQTPGLYDYRAFAKLRASRAYGNVNASWTVECDDHLFPSMDAMLSVLARLWAAYPDVFGVGAVTLKFESRPNWSTTLEALRTWTDRGFIQCVRAGRSIMQFT